MPTYVPYRTWFTDTTTCHGQGNLRDLRVAVQPRIGHGAAASAMPPGGVRTPTLPAKTAATTKPTEIDGVPTYVRTYVRTCARTYVHMLVWCTCRAPPGASQAPARAPPPCRPRHTSPKTSLTGRKGPSDLVRSPRRPRPLPPDCHPSATRLPPRRPASTHRQRHSRVTVRAYEHTYVPL